ncbi:hypothetical protein A5784_10680 [Mycobacterium sp. 852013-50091_SCH5140682]|uniref:hypothetical protein n=1 Tax=Mycobacterium sp. 852013-50091_SCH5140682 TaxID=1834109 RepID=UPI0007E9C262|nr:hypothetical protein [Mycobacterium sp. 852013-50091_SCH5140682]OBC05836.1 hypothetical protein A5784_10680 [Mycobacterium sp. 852013-50091_SCH5140682]
MKLDIESGLWSSGTLTEPAPLVAVLEVSGAVLSWVVDDGAAAPVITFTDHLRADWLWRVVGEDGHVAVVEALRDAAGGTAQAVDLPGVAVLPGSTDALRRLAFGHWLRRWWPASDRDGIAALDRAVLDAELAVSTVAAEDFLTDDTLDSDVDALLAPHVSALNNLSAQGDPRVIALVDRCRELAEDIGLGWHVAEPTRRRSDYALAAGAAEAGRAAAAIAGGVSTVSWTAVPPGIFDAAERTVDWTVVPVGSSVNCLVQVAVCGPDHPAGIAAAVRCGDYRGTGVLDADGRAALAVLGADGAALPESHAWNLDWSPAEVAIGATAAGEPQHVRDRVRAFARNRLAAVSDTRLAAVAADAYLAEVLAAESDY